MKQPHTDSFIPVKRLYYIYIHTHTTKVFVVIYETLGKRTHKVLDLFNLHAFQRQNNSAFLYKDINIVIPFRGRL